MTYLDTYVLQEARNMHGNWITNKIVSTCIKNKIYELIFKIWLYSIHEKWVIISLFICARILRTSGCNSHCKNLNIYSINPVIN